MRAQAYTGAQLDRQPEEQAALFLADRSRNWLEGDRLKVSSIFKWYRGDFEAGWRGASSLSEFLVLYAGALGLAKVNEQDLRSGKIDIDFLDYDWRLNAKRN